MSNEVFLKVGRRVPYHNQDQRLFMSLQQRGIEALPAAWLEPVWSIICSVNINILAASK